MKMENDNDSSITQKRMKQLNTKVKVKNKICYALAEWFETGHVPLYNYLEKFHNAIWSQGAIGWR